MTAAESLVIAQMGPFGPMGFGAMFGLFAVGMVAIFVVSILIAVWVYRDAEERGMNGVLWLLVVLVANIIGLIIYLVIRTDHPKQTEGGGPYCPDCGSRVQTSDKHCSSCGRALGQGA